MSVIKGAVIAFSIYSKIPVPQFPWKEADMKYHLCFFPLVGAVIGGLELFWWWLCQTGSVGTLCFTLLGTAIPLLVSGGFHVDGFMDTMDAFHSYQPREKKLEILKDAHIGAFAGIMLLLYYLLYAGIFSEIGDVEAMGVVALGFVLSRGLSAVAVVSLPSAKAEGMLFLFADRAHKKIVKAVLSVQLLLVMGAMLLVGGWKSVCAIGAALLGFWYYAYKSRKELGGITGDTAGFFVTVCEEAILAAVVLASFVAG